MVLQSHLSSSSFVDDRREPAWEGVLGAVDFRCGHLRHERRGNRLSARPHRRGGSTCGHRRSWHPRPIHSPRYQGRCRRRAPPGRPRRGVGGNRPWRCCRSHGPGLRQLVPGECRAGVRDDRGRWGRRHLHRLPGPARTAIRRAKADGLDPRLGRRVALRRRLGHRDDALGHRHGRAQRPEPRHPSQRRARHHRHGARRDRHSVSRCSASRRPA